MKRRAFVAGIVGGVTALAGLYVQSSQEGGSADQSDLTVKSVEPIEYKPKDYEDRPKVAGSVKVIVRNPGEDPLTITGLRITGDVPSPHDEGKPGVFSVPSREVIEKVSIAPGESQQIRTRHEPLYYVDMASEGERSQEDLDASTCSGETKTATLQFETEQRGTIDKEIELTFSGESVEFDEFAPDYGCTNVTISSPEQM